MSYIPKDYTKISTEQALQRGIPKTNPVVSNAGWNDKQDAFRHANSSARLARDYGPWAAQAAGTFREIIKPNSRAEYWMDERNNGIGREIGVWAARNNKSDEDIADEVKRRIDTGEIVTTPYDPRRTLPQHGDWERAKRESFEEIRRDYQESMRDAENNEERAQWEERFRIWEQERQAEIARQEAERQAREAPQGIREGEHDVWRRQGTPGPASGGGDVQVRAYVRGKADVRHHVRSYPDGNPQNNRGR